MFKGKSGERRDEARQDSFAKCREGWGQGRATARIASGFPHTAPVGLRVSAVEDKRGKLVPETDLDGNLIYTVDYGRRREPQLLAFAALCAGRSQSHVPTGRCHRAVVVLHRGHQYFWAATTRSSWSPCSQAFRPIFEYACHEGNYAMEGILAGSRAIDRAAAEAGTWVSFGAGPKPCPERLRSAGPRSCVLARSQSFC